MWAFVPIIRDATEMRIADCIKNNPYEKGIG